MQPFWLEPNTELSTGDPTNPDYYWEGLGSAEISPYDIPGLLGSAPIKDDEAYTGNVLGLLETNEYLEDVITHLGYDYKRFGKLAPDLQKRILDRLMQFQPVPAPPAQTAPAQVYDPAAFMDGTRFFQPINPLEHQTWLRGLKSA